MADFKTSYGTSTGITCTFTIANGSSQQSAAVDNGTTKFLDALVFVTLGTAASSTSATGFLLVYAYGTADSGSNYTEGASGSNASITLTSPTNLKLIGFVNAVANSTTYKAGPFSVAKGFDGVLPEKWGIVITNSTGATLLSGSAIFQGIMNTYA